MLKPFGLTLLILGLAGAAGRAEPLERFTFQQAHMGTRFRLVLYAADQATANKAAEAAFRRIAELDGIMSDYRPASELMQVCQNAGGPAVTISPDLFDVLQRGQELARRTDGAFDMTIGPVVRLWRQARKTRKLPEPAELTQARDLVGHQNLQLDPKDRTIRLTRPGMQLDLGGIAKGYAADAALAVLKKHGLNRALVVAGGDIVAGDPPPEVPAWRIGIAPLDDPDRPPTRFIGLKNAAVSTSGDAEQFVEIGGNRYSHIVDPKTGLGLLGRSSVTVIAPNGTASDSLATAVSVLGPEKGLALIENTPGTAAFIIRKDDRGVEETASSRGLKDFLIVE
jgi:thiamine biosynthesis lipoprotein